MAVLLSENDNKERLKDVLVLFLMQEDMEELLFMLV